MFCTMEDIGRGLQRFCWPPTTPTTGPAMFPVAFDHRNILPTMMISSAGLASPSKCYVMPSLAQQQQQQQQQQQLPVNISPPRHMLPVPFQHLGNFVMPSVPTRSSSPVSDRDAGNRRRRHPNDDDFDVNVHRRTNDRHRRHPPTIDDCEAFVDSKENGGNDDEVSCVRRRATTTTSFTIADILEGRIGNTNCSDKRRRTKSPQVCDRSPSISASDERHEGPECRLNTPLARRPTVSELVRPWKVTHSASSHVTLEDTVSRRSSSSSVFSASPEVNNEYSDDDDDEDNDEIDEDVDVDDAGSVGRRHSSGLQSTSDSVCPLGALLRMTSQTNFDASSGSGLQECLATFDDSASDGNGSSYESQGHHISRRALFPVSSTVADAKCFRSCRKRRKTRTAFTNQQIAELERWFGRQKYLTPADRDEIASTLRLSAAQVITWFQNRRAKLKRDLEELKADVAAAKALGTEPSTAVLDRLAELTRASALQQQGMTSSSAGMTSSATTPVAGKMMESECRSTV